MGLDRRDNTKSSPTGACFRNVIRPSVNVERIGGRPLWLRITDSGRTWLHVRKCHEPTRRISLSRVHLARWRKLLRFKPSACGRPDSASALSESWTSEHNVIHLIQCPVANTSTELSTRFSLLVVRGSILDERTLRCVRRAECLLAWNGCENIVEIPELLGFRPRFDPDQIHVVHM
jgi:hypothetical protein